MKIDFHMIFQCLNMWQNHINGLVGITKEQPWCGRFSLGCCGWLLSCVRCVAGLFRIIKARYRGLVFLAWFDFLMFLTHYLQENCPSKFESPEFLFFFTFFLHDIPGNNFWQRTGFPIRFFLGFTGRCGKVTRPSVTFWSMRRGHFHQMFPGWNPHNH